MLTAREAAVTSAIRVRRVYEDPEPGDGSRILVDGLWPRGLRKDAAALDDWLRDAAPSCELRTWYRHDPAKFAGVLCRAKTLRMA